MDIDKKLVAKVIQNARRNAKLTQAELAEKIGISEKHLSKIETGKNYPALDNFLKMVEVLKLSLKDFGLDDYCSEISTKKQYLQKIINISSEKQLDVYVDMIDTLQKHF